MARDSYNVRRKRRLRRNVSLLARALKQTQQQLQTANLLLLMLLKQDATLDPETKVASVHISKEVFRDIVSTAQFLGYKSTPAKDDSGFYLELIDNTPKNSDVSNAEAIPAADSRTSSLGINGGVEYVQSSEEEWPDSEGIAVPVEQSVGEEVV